MKEDTATNTFKDIPRNLKQWFIHRVNILDWRIKWIPGSSEDSHICLLESEGWASQVALVVNSPPANAEDVREASSITRLGRSPGGGNGNPLQYSCLEDPLDRGTWRATVDSVAKNQKRQSNWTCTHLRNIASWIPMDTKIQRCSSFF